MKKALLVLSSYLLACTFSIQAQDVSTLSWSQVCSGKMGTEWYGTDEAQRIADDVLYVQKVSGGWMKNDELHKHLCTKTSAL